MWNPFLMYKMGEMEEVRNGKMPVLSGNSLYKPNPLIRQLSRAY